VIGAATVARGLQPSNLAHLRVAADIGGTFIDIAAFDETNKRLLLGKSLSTPQALVDGIEAGSHQSRYPVPRCRLVPSRLNGRDQHDTRAHRRQGGVADDTRIS
jgi:hypothetical protein